MKTSNLVHHALTEILLAYHEDCDVLDGVMITDVIHSVEHFSEEGHSGGSAPYGIAKLCDDIEAVVSKKQADIVRLLCSFEPLTPLTGDDSEWFIHDMNGIYAQNKRCGRIFKDKDGRAYDCQALVYRDPDGTTWVGPNQDVTFPYTPKTVTVDRPVETA